MKLVGFDTVASSKSRGNVKTSDPVVINEVGSFHILNALRAYEENSEKEFCGWLSCSFEDVHGPKRA